MYFSAMYRVDYAYIARLGGVKQGWV